MFKPYGIQTIAICSVFLPHLSEVDSALQQKMKCSEICLRSKSEFGFWRDPAASTEGEQYHCCPSQSPSASDIITVASSQNPTSSHTALAHSLHSNQRELCKALQWLPVHVKEGPNLVVDGLQGISGPWTCPVSFLATLPQTPVAVFQIHRLSVPPHLHIRPFIFPDFPSQNVLPLCMATSSSLLSTSIQN